MKNDNSAETEKPTRLVIFIGKGGSGKTTTAVFAAQHYAMLGLNTCLVIHSQDPTADYLLNCKIGTSPIKCNENLSAVRLETTKMLLEPLVKLKEADSRLNMTQGVLEGVVGEELGILPGMDSIFSALALERYVKFFGISQASKPRDKYDVVIYDGMNTEETLRILGATSKARRYLKHMRNLTEKTDLGRLAGPSMLRLVDEAVNISGRGSRLNGGSSSEVWDYLEKILEKGSSILTEPCKFGCYIVMDPKSRPSLNFALRYWGCAIQAGVHLSGAIGIASPNSYTSLLETVNDSFATLPSALIPHISFDTVLDWENIILSAHSKDARHLFTLPSDDTSAPPSVKFDPAKRSVTLLMPGFDKSEIKLYQFSGGSELLVEAGDQRRVIRLPRQIQGKVAGAKLTDRSLVITTR
ncbi:hypothetical protein LIER_11688 [Lithospermum erythrorhizon]|uniref:P-loop containing nucleoside triphosphate hydrolases superfamily protein n=1 Tax=Lithospermum erythrorhizon TaxID=34254 RepID=A0AAV3PTA3_LITER